jgi:hypothetical protein
VFDVGVVDEICVMMLFVARFVLVAAAIDGCNGLLANLTFDSCALRRLFGEESPKLFTVAPFKTDAGGLILT